VIIAADLYRVQIPMVAPFRTAKSTTAVKDALLVRVETRDGVFGWGECVAQADRSYLPVNIDDCWAVLRDACFGSENALHPVAYAALEGAEPDAELRATNTSLAEHLGATREFVTAGVAIGRIDHATEFARAVEAYAAAGYTRIKCKIQPGRDLGPLRIARQHAPDVELAADANGSYSPVAAQKLLERVEGFALQCVEQPCSDPLALRGNTMVCLDESITTPDDIAVAHQAGTADAVSIKPGRLGGAAPTRAALDICATTGLGALPGGMLETGIGRATLLAFAAMPQFTLTGDISASERYFGPDGDLTEPFVLENGRLRVPTSAGIGVEPIAERLAACTVAHERLTKD
jgi:O-succinylbenzoate synthase